MNAKAKAMKASKGQSHNTLSKKRKAASNATTETSAYPKRNLDQLYCPAITYLCAIGAHQGQSKPCVPCAYKMCNFDIALDKQFTSQIPNQRPEQCPRSSSSHASSSGGGRSEQTDVNTGADLGYQRGMKVLTVGDGDFTYSLAVARLIFGDGDCKSNNNANKEGMVMATSYEDSQTLRGVYPDFDNTLTSLKSYGGTSITIAYNVDATRLDATLPDKAQQNNKRGIKFQRICWNFPCSAIGSGQDGQNDAMEQNKELVRKFVANALPYLDDNGGEIHMIHKTKPPFNQWGLEKVALEGIDCSSIRREFEYKGRIAFDKCTLPPYTPRKALDRKSFPCHDACIYVFGWRGECDKRDVGACQPTIPEKHLECPHDEVPKSSSVIPVTESMIEKIRLTHLHFATENRHSKMHGRGKKRRREKR